MKMRFGNLRRVAIGLTALSAAMAYPAYAEEAEVCDRACLTSYVDRYLSALEKRDPNFLPLTDDVKFTENGVELELGDAAWGTVTSAGSYRVIAADPERGEVAFIGTMVENHDRHAIMALRLKVAAGKISEIETVWGRTIEGAQALNGLGKPHSAFTTVVSENKRHSREELVAIANKYFTGLEDNDGHRDVPFTETCNRLENGRQTTNSKAPPRDPSQPNTMALGCDAQLRSGRFRLDTDIRERRFRVVDQERGLVFAFVFFDHAGTVFEYPLTTGEMIRTNLRQPHTWQIAEIFKVQDGKIDQIEAVLNEVPYGMKSGWSDCSGVFPRPCTEPGAPQRKTRVGLDYSD